MTKIEFFGFLPNSYSKKSHFSKFTPKVKKKWIFYWPSGGVSGVDKYVFKGIRSIGFFILAVWNFEGSFLGYFWSKMTLKIRNFPQIFKNLTKMSKSLFLSVKYAFKPPNKFWDENIKFLKIYAKNEKNIWSKKCQKWPKWPFWDFFQKFFFLTKFFLLL